MPARARSQYLLSVMCQDGEVKRAIVSLAPGCSSPHSRHKSGAQRPRRNLAAQAAAGSARDHARRAVEASEAAVAAALHGLQKRTRWRAWIEASMPARARKLYIQSRN